MFWRAKVVFSLAVHGVSLLTGICIANHRESSSGPLIVKLSSHFRVRSRPTHANRCTEATSIAQLIIILGLVAIAVVMFTPPDLISTDDGAFSGVPAFVLTNARIANGANSAFGKKMSASQDTVGVSTIPGTHARPPESNAPIQDCHSILRSSCSLRC
jgi:hypothetical protein